MQQKTCYSYLDLILIYTRWIKYVIYCYMIHIKIINLDHEIVKGITVNAIYHIISVIH